MSCNGICCFCSVPCRRVIIIEEPVEKVDYTIEDEKPKNIVKSIGKLIGVKNVQDKKVD